MQGVTGRSQSQQMHISKKTTNENPVQIDTVDSSGTYNNIGGDQETYRSAMTAKEAFLLFLTAEIVDKVVLYTSQVIEKIRDQNPEQVASYKVTWLGNTTRKEIYALVGLQIIHGLHKANYQYADILWGKYGHPIYASTMSNKRYMFLLAHLRFDDKIARERRYLFDRGTAIREFFDDFNYNCRKIMILE